MPTVDVIDFSGKVVGSLELAEEVFGVEPNLSLLHEAVRHFQAERRAGTHSTKVRHEVSGSGKKLWRQKGTGRARMGSIRSPIWRHGGTVHGPKPRSYAFKLNKKEQLGALRSALSAKLADGAIKVVKDFDLSSHKTGELAKILGALEVSGKTLLVNNGDARNLELASRNIPNLTLVSGREMHPYHLLGHERILFSQATVESCNEVLR
ncbi:MAG: 50S ribosomal protein L4 [Acidobacteria bacterium]|nr:50S ribosomal protein L4 [Acidobacteriota bacterium]